MEELWRHEPGRCVSTCVLALVFVLVALPRLALATSDLIVIDEILASWQGDNEIQFVELRMTAAGQEQVAGSEIEVLDGSGMVIARLPFPSSVSNALVDARILIATPKLESLAGLSADFRVVDADLIPLLRRNGGRICYRALDPSGTQTVRVDCVAYGTFKGENGAFGTPTPVTPVNRSLQRIQNTADNDADFQGVLEPTPQNNLGHRAVLQTVCLGDGNIDPGEECDGKNLDGKTCVSEGFASGTLRCSQCHLDTSDCSDCGNGKLDPGEECDGESLDTTTCTRLGFTSGTLTCSEDCTFDTGDCEELQIPGGAPARKDCFLEWSVANPGSPVQKGRPVTRQQCVDGNPTCDFDAGTPRSCTFHVRLCFNRDDLRLRRCTPRGISGFKLRRPLAESADPSDHANATRLLAAVSALGIATQEESRIIFSPALETGDLCTDAVDVVVPLRERPEKSPRPGKRVLKTAVTDGKGRRRDRDKIKLRCLRGAE